MKKFLSLAVIFGLFAALGCGGGASTGTKTTGGPGLGSVRRSYPGYFLRENRCLPSAGLSLPLC